MTFFDFSQQVKEIEAKENSLEGRLGARWKAVYQNFPKAVDDAGWRLLRAGEYLDESKLQNTIIFGLALWSPVELICLDSLVESLLDSQISGYVFDIDDIKSPVDLNKFMPNVSLPLSTPVIAGYKGGKLLLNLEGNEAKLYIKQLKIKTDIFLGE